MADSEFVAHEPCPNPDCGSSDALARYDDGHGHCFACGYHENAEGEAEERPKEKSKKMADLIQGGEHRPLNKRKISQETCEKFDYRVGTYKGKTVQIANYKRGNRTVGQKVRFPDKDFLFLGEIKESGLYGQHLWRDQGKMVVITEGEIDALSVSQLQGNKYPVVSIPNGSKGAKKAIQRELQWLEGFGSVILMFDNDEAGEEAVAECAPLFTPGKCKVARLPLKDANDMLVAGRGSEVIEAIWGAKTYRPDGIVSIEDIIDEVEKPIEFGLPWWCATLTKLTYGRRYGEVYTFGAGTGIGKTDWLMQQVCFDVTELNEKVGLIFLEQPPVETAKRVAGKLAGKRFHVPDDGWTTDELKSAVSQLNSKVTFYDSFGETAWDVVKVHIRYMAVSQGIKLIYLDHLTAMADTSNERESLEQIMKELAGQAKELGIIVHLVSHLTTPDQGKPHEEGGRVTIRQFKGSRAIGFWSYFMFGLERDQQAEDIKERQTTTFRILKDRYTGQSTGVTFDMDYDHTTGRLKESDSDPFADETSSDGFGDIPF